MKQETFTDIEYSFRKKKTKREEFLEIMDEIPLTPAIRIARRCRINSTMPTQIPMSATPKKLVMVLRNWRNICVCYPWIITTQFSICVAACAVHTNAKPSWMACNTALS